MNTKGKGHVWLALAALAISLSSWAAVAQLPASKGAPKVGEKIPDFTLPDSNGQPVRLSDYFADPKATPERKGSWVLLIFYRGYW